MSKRSFLDRMRALPVLPQSVRRLVRPALGALLLVAAVWALRRTLREAPPRAVMDAAVQIGLPGLVACLALTAVCYLLLTGYDALAWRHLGRRLPYAGVARASFVAYGLAHTVGASLVTGALARDRFHSRRGVPSSEAAAVAAFCALTSFLGYLAMTGVALLAWPHAALTVGVAPGVARAVGLGALALVAAYAAASAMRIPPLRVRGRTLAFPAPRIALAQVGIGLVEWLVAALALLPLLPEGFPLGPMMVAFALAKTAAFFVHTPGGVGVFEAAVVALAPAAAAPAAVVAGLLLYRALHFGVPFVAATALLGAHMLRGNRGVPGAAEPRAPREA